MTDNAVLSEERVEEVREGFLGQMGFEVGLRMRIWLEGKARGICLSMELGGI